MRVSKSSQFRQGEGKNLGLVFPRFLNSEETVMLSHRPWTLHCINSAATDRVVLNCARPDGRDADFHVG
jgi:hypothetical protein